MRATHTVNGILGAGLVLGSLLTVGALPEQIPVHFGATGAADASAPTSLWAWLQLPLVGISLAALLYGIAWALPKKPAWVNTPNPKAYEALSTDGKHEVIGVVQRFLYASATGLLALFGVLQAGTYHAAVGDGTLPVYAYAAIGAFVVGSMAGALWLIVAVQRAVKRAHDGNKGAAGVTSAS